MSNSCFFFYFIFQRITMSLHIFVIIVYVVLLCSDPGHLINIYEIEIVKGKY
jgi:hypothetical protein